jgi:hypothetical protein
MGNAIALTGWVTLWFTLSRDPFRWRILYFVIGFGGLLTLIQFAGGEWRIDGEWGWPVQFAKLIVGVATLLVIVRRWGFRLSANDSTAVGRDTSAGQFQFSIGDLLVAITGVAIFVALVISDGQSVREDVLITGSFVLTVVGVSVLLLSLRRIWIAIAICLVIIPAVGYSAMWVASVGGWPWELSRAAGACLLIAAGALRLCGYRLKRIS